MGTTEFFMSIEIWEGEREGGIYRDGGDWESGEREPKQVAMIGIKKL